MPAETAIAIPGSTSATAASAMASFSLCWSADLSGEARLEQGGSCDRGRAAVDLLEQTALVEDLEVATDGHVGHAELAHEVGDPHGAVLAHAVEDERLTLAREHQGSLDMPDRIAPMDTRPHPF